MIGGFIIGVITGGVAMWQYGDQIREFVDDKTKTMRHKAADRPPTSDRERTGRETC